MAPAAAGECVVLLHGLGRSAASMEVMAGALESDGFVVANIDYPSRDEPIEALAPLAVERGLDECARHDAATVHFVTHSLGGILVRQYLHEHTIPALGRTVMLAPPNQGSEAADRLRNWPGFGLLNGDAGYQLGTGAASVPRGLGPVDFEVGVIAGDRTIDPFTSLFLDNPDDGKVSVESTRVEGMKDFVVVHASHALMMRSPEVIGQVLNFLREGRFLHEAQD